jgi:nitroreductase
MTDTLTTLKTRRSCRKFDGRPITEEQLNTILEAGTYAPTGMGKQSPIMIAVQDKQTIEKLSKMNAAVMGAGIDPFYGAATVVIVLADRKVPTYLYDGSLVMGNLMNAAEAVGVQSCWIHRAKEVFDSEEGKALLKEWGVEGDYEGIGNCVLGYGEKAPEKPRKENYIYRV